MKIIVCGGRDYDNAEYMTTVLDELHAATEITSVVHGDARGADRMAAMWAHRNGIEVIPYPADWTRYGDGAGHIRNAEMLQENPQMVIAFPGGGGTANMVKIAKKARIPTMEYDPEDQSFEDVWGID